MSPRLRWPLALPLLFVLLPGELGAQTEAASSCPTCVTLPLPACARPSPARTFHDVFRNAALLDGQTVTVRGVLTHNYACGPFVVTADGACSQHCEGTVSLVARRGARARTIALVGAAPETFLCTGSSEGCACCGVDVRPRGVEVMGVVRTTNGRVRLEAANVCTR